MAMLDEYGPTSSEMRDTFERAATAGPGFMLLISETLDDPLQVTIYHTTACVSSDAEILPLLRQKIRSTSYSEFRLTALYDLTKDYNDQRGQPLENQIKTLLSEETRAGIQAIKNSYR